MGISTDQLNHVVKAVLETEHRKLQATTKRTYVDRWYESPINLSEKTVGKFSIKHRFETNKMPIVGARQAILRGLGIVSTAVPTKPHCIHELYEEGHGLWMTDMPEELNQIHEMIHDVNPWGRVLIGGLGLGIVARLLVGRPGLDLDKLTVVELSRDVIELALPSRDKSLETACLRSATVCSDIRDHLANGKQYDYYLLDTWGGTGEATWWENVLPLRRLIRQRWGSKPKIHCWAEDIMWGQVEQSLLRPNARHWSHKNLPAVMSTAEVKAFQQDAGLPAWEKKYGKAIDDVVEHAC